MGHHADVLICTLTVGGGHVHRDLAIGQALVEVAPHLRVRYASGGPAAEMYRRAGVEVDAVLRYEETPTRDGSVDAGRARWTFLRCELLHAVRVAALVRRYRPRLVLLDEIVLACFLVRALGPRLGFLTDIPTIPSRSGGPGQYLVSSAMDGIHRMAIRCADVAFYAGTCEHLPEPALWPWVKRHMAVVGHMANSARSTNLAPAEARRRLRVPAGAPLVLATVGGTRTARYLLQAAIDAWPRVAHDSAHLAVICGPAIQPRDLALDGCPRLHVLGVVDDLPAYLHAADVAIVHAGLSTITECMAVGVAMICSPIEGLRERENNARFAARVAGATVIRRDSLTPARLAAKIDELLGDEELRERMSRPVAAQTMQAGARRVARRLLDFL